MLLPFVLLTFLFLGYGQDIEVSDTCTATSLISVSEGTNAIVESTFEMNNDLPVITGSTSNSITSPTSQTTGNAIQFWDSAVSTDGACPVAGVTNCYYVVYGIDDGTSFPSYIGIYDADNNQIINEVQLDQPLTDITFDADGNIYGVNTDAGPEVYRVNPTTGATTTFGTAQGTTCTVQAPDQCLESVFYDSDQDQLYRLSSGATDILLCKLPSNTDCVDVLPEQSTDAPCTSSGERAWSVTFMGDEKAVVTCALLVNNDSSRFMLLDLDNPDQPTLDDPTPSQQNFQASGVAFFNSNTPQGYCAPDFEGSTGSGGDDDDDDDSSDDSSDDDDSDDDSDDDDSDDDSDDDAKAFFARLDDSEMSQQTEEEVQYTYVVSLSDSSISIAWIMFGVCMMVNITVVVCMWRRK